MVIGAHGQHTVLVQLHVVVDIKEELDFVTILLQNMVGGIVLVKVMINSHATDISAKVFVRNIVMMIILLYRMMRMESSVHLHYLSNENIVQF